MNSHSSVLSHNMHYGSGRESQPDSLPASRKGTSRSAIPGPRPPLIGWQARLLPILRDPVLGMLKLRQRYGDIVAFGQSPAAPVLIFGPEYNHQVLTNPALFYNLDVNSGVAPIQMPRHTAAARLLSGVAGMNGEKHTHHRRLLMPAFHKKRVEMLRDTIVACTEAHLAGIRGSRQTLTPDPRPPTPVEVDLAHEMVELSLSLAVSGLLGLRPGEEGHHVHDLLSAWGKSALSISVELLPFDRPGFPYRRFLRLSEQLEEEFRQVIAQKRDQRARAQSPLPQGVAAHAFPLQDTQSSDDRGDALSILLDAQDEQGDGLSDAELMGHLTTFFTAGHETSASALTWTLFLLAQHPQVMHDLMDELDATLHGDAPSLQQLGELPLLEGVINESLRLFPPGTWMLRTSTAPFTIGGYDLPEATHLVFSPAVTHRQPDIYPEPNRFLPERWSTIKPSTYEYLPFGGGPRRCLGATFALMELKVALPIILQRYRLEVLDGTRVDRGGTILSFPRGGLPTHLHPQDRQFTRSRLRGNIHQLLDLHA
ncbi:MAG: cytochrome P450 [Chloroflexia bacterium]